jgi:hypothetical protein
MNDTLRSQFSVGKACEELWEVNKILSFAAADFLTAREFKPYEALPKGEAARGVVIIDGLWATQVFRDPGALEKIVEVCERKRQVYQESLQELGGLSIEKDPDKIKIWEIAKGMLEPLLSTEVSTKKQFLSFASKFLHWHAPEHLPIVDSHARAAIRRLQNDSGELPDGSLSPETPASVSGKISDYAQWIRFYGKLIRELTQEDRESLKSTDREFLPPQFRREYSLLRVLDKVFWYRGKGG